MRLTRARTALLAAGAGALGLGTWLTSRTPAPASTAHERMVAPAIPGTTGTSPPIEATRVAVDAPIDAPSAAPQPPWDTPLDALWSALQGPARAGDARAACRLAIETLRCAHATAGMAAFASSPEDTTGELAALLAFEGSPSSASQDAAGLDPEAQAALALMQDRLERVAARCDGLSDERATASLALLRSAALAGQPDAQVLYAGGEGWFLSIPGALGRPEFEQWRREAPLVVARMLDAGHPDAPGLLAGAYSGQTWLSGLYEPDPERAAAYLFLSARLMGKPEAAESQLRERSVEERALARQRSDALFAQHYGDTDRRSSARFWLGAGTRLLQSGIDEQGPGELPCALP